MNRRERSRMSGGGARRERGVALLIALILVALAAILATKLTYDSWLERRRVVGIIAVEQSYQFGLGAEAIAADALTRTLGAGGTTGGTGTPGVTPPAPPGAAAGQGNMVTLAQPWAQPTQALPITPENDPEAAPIGTLQGALEDMQGRFNLNTLAHMVSGGAAANGASATPGGAAVVQDPVPLQIFQRLLVSVGLEPKWAGIARDWIDTDNVPGEPDGAEDAVYTQQNPPYRTGNYPMLSPSELMNMPGFGADRYRRIAPYVTALPNASTQINICTAPPQVLEALADNLRGEFVNNEALIAGRRLGCFPDLETLKSILGGNAATLQTWLGTGSQFFRLTTRVRLGTTDFTLYSLLRFQNSRVTPVLRTFGTY
jgi:general secretion pathway protein K